MYVIEFVYKTVVILYRKDGELLWRDIMMKMVICELLIYRNEKRGVQIAKRFICKDWKNKFPVFVIEIMIFVRIVVLKMIQVCHMNIIIPNWIDE